MTVSRLKEIIRTQLKSLIDSDYVFLEIPFYANPGDIAIWKGTIDFLSELPYRCLYTASLRSCNMPPISSETIILLQGGGNFGDLYPLNQQFRNSIIENYPQNRIIVLPQTVHYNSAQSIRHDVQLMRKHKRLVLCARDNRSYTFLKRFHFAEDIRLVPDMAFYNNMSDLSQYMSACKKSSVLIKRTDAELHNSSELRNAESRQMDVCDWDLLSLSDSVTQAFEDKTAALKPDNYSDYNQFLISTYFPHALRVSVEQLSQYQHVYCTRLHAAIIAALLDKEITLFDNSYSKNKTFFDTWLQQESTIHFAGRTSHSNLTRSFRMLLAYYWVTLDILKSKLE